MIRSRHAASTSAGKALVGVAACACLCLSPSALLAQNSISWVPTEPSDWSVNENWTGNEPDGGPFVPEGRFAEQAVINNGGVAQLSAVLDNSGASGSFGPGNIIIGEGESDSGALEILSGGLMTLDDTGSGVDGSTIVGQEGRGTLRIMPGGALVTDSLSLGGSPESLIELSGTASLTSNGASTLNATTRILGADVAYSTQGLTFGETSDFNPQITAAGVSTITVDGVSVLGGALSVDFSGVTPTAGDTWDLINADAILGEFASIDAPGLGPLQPGQVFGVRNVPGEGARDIVQLFLEQKLTLTINRDTGVVAINNLGSDAVTFDGYTVESPSGSLDVAAWTPLEENPLTPGWQASNNADAQRVTETNPFDATSLASATRELGALFAPTPTTFGEDLEDLTFEYATPGGAVVEGVVEYEGLSGINNLVLVVDPDSGDAQIRNPSAFTVSIDGYTVTSDSGSLLTSWSGLAGNELADEDWQKSANSDANRLTETNPFGEEQFVADAVTRLGVGGLFDPNGVQDLAFEFVLAGDSDATTGIVVYADFAAEGLAGDYNNDGVVDARDYTVWRDNLGTSVTLPNDETPGSVTAADYEVWRTNYGQSAGASVASAAPEPSGFAIALLSGATLVRARRRRGSWRGQ